MTSRKPYFQSPDDCDECFISMLLSYAIRNRDRLNSGRLELKLSPAGFNSICRRIEAYRVQNMTLLLRSGVSRDPTGSLSQLAHKDDSALLDDYCSPMSVYEIAAQIRALKLVKNDQKIVNTAITSLDFSHFKSLNYLSLEAITKPIFLSVDSLRSKLSVLKIHRSNISIDSILGADLPESADEWMKKASQQELEQYKWEKLTDIQFYDNEIKRMDATLNLLPSLKRLDMSANCIRKVENLVHSPFLESLNLSFNQISSMASLRSAIGRIRSLTLRGNRISSLFGLAGLPLEFLDLGQNLLSTPESVQELSQLPLLTRIILEDNPICYGASYRLSIFIILADQIVEKGEAFQLDRKAPGTSEISRLKHLVEANRRHRAPVAVISNEIDDSYGHVITESSGHVEDEVESVSSSSFADFSYYAVSPITRSSKKKKAKSRKSRVSVAEFSTLSTPTIDQHQANDKPVRDKTEELKERYGEMWIQQLTKENEADLTVVQEEEKCEVRIEGDDRNVWEMVQPTTSTDAATKVVNAVRAISRAKVLTEATKEASEENKEPALATTPAEPVDETKLDTSEQDTMEKVPEAVSVEVPDEEGLKGFVGVMELMEKVGQEEENWASEERLENDYLVFTVSIPCRREGSSEDSYRIQPEQRMLLLSEKENRFAEYTDAGAGALLSGSDADPEKEYKLSDLVVYIYPNDNLVDETMFTLIVFVFAGKSGRFSFVPYFVTPFGCPGEEATSRDITSVVDHYIFEKSMPPSGESFKAMCLDCSSCFLAAAYFRQCPQCRGLKLIAKPTMPESLDMVEAFHDNVLFETIGSSIFSTISGLSRMLAESKMYENEPKEDPQREDFGDLNLIFSTKLFEKSGEQFVGFWEIYHSKYDYKTSLGTKVGLVLSNAYLYMVKEVRTNNFKKMHVRPLNIVRHLHVSLKEQRIRIDMTKKRPYYIITRDPKVTGDIIARMHSTIISLDDNVDFQVSYDSDDMTERLAAIVDGQPMLYHMVSASLKSAASGFSFKELYLTDVSVALIDEHYTLYPAIDPEIATKRADFKIKPIPSDFLKGFAIKPRNDISEVVIDDEGLIVFHFNDVSWFIHCIDRNHRDRLQDDLIDAGIAIK